jgi:sugar lactone lactonase YvrE
MTTPTTPPTSTPTIVPSDGAPAPRPLTSPGALLGEGPAWEAATGQLLWVDIWRGVLHATDPSASGDVVVADLGAPLSAVLVTSRGTRVVTAGLCVLELPEEGSAGGVEEGTRHLADLPERPCLRANDAAVDPAGRLWVGTMTMPERPQRSGNVWCLDPGSHAPRLVLEDLQLANGMGWSPAGDRMYVVDSRRGRVDAYAYDPADGRLGEPHELVVIPEEDGMPDGLAVDVEGCLWVALAGGGMVRRYAPDGSVLDQVRMPVAFPTSCAFGGPGLRQLFVTTGSRPVDSAQRASAVAAGAGALFVVDPDVPGVPVSPMEV